jgi:hypothetical protein
MLSLDATFGGDYFITSACLLLIGLEMSADVDWLVDLRCVSIVRHVGNNFHYICYLTYINSHGDVRILTLRRMEYCNRTM